MGEDNFVGLLYKHKTFNWLSRNSFTTCSILTQSDDILIIFSLRCYSYLCRIDGKQVISLKRTGCLYHGIIQHELNHALTRSDRDKYVKINWEDIPTDKANNFQIRNTNNQNTTYEYTAQSCTMEKQPSPPKLEKAQSLPFLMQQWK